MCCGDNSMLPGNLVAMERFTGQHRTTFRSKKFHKNSDLCIHYLVS